MARPVYMVYVALTLLACSSIASAAIVEHSFHAWGISVTERLGCWPEFTTQCPIRPGKSYTYKFTITGQVGTLWWHAHVQWLRATVHGALIIRPRPGHSYPFPMPHAEIPILFGEWWNANVVDVANEALATGAEPNISDAYTINGQPGHLYPCSSTNTYKLNVTHGKTHLLRIVNAALNNQLFFKIANHKMTVVGVDASYTDPYITDVVVVAPGQTADILLVADQSPGAQYYMAGTPYASASGSFDNTTTTAILAYNGPAPPSTPPIMPVLPDFNDTPTAHKFFTGLTGLVSSPFWAPVPLQVDQYMFVTVGCGLTACDTSTISCQGPFGQKMAASMNNVSFQFPTRLSMLEAFFRNTSDGVYTTDFPDNPPLVFDYTNASNTMNRALVMTTKSTKVKQLRFNSTVEIVFQNTALLGTENHPIHLHGFNFHVLAQGFGNYNNAIDGKKFNLKNPQERNTIAVPVGGWAVIRFRANNPGVWLMHCHFDVHVPWGLATAFVVGNGPTPSTTLLPPPLDFPKCY